MEDEPADILLSRLELYWLDSCSFTCWLVVVISALPLTSVSSPSCVTLFFFWSSSFPIADSFGSADMIGMGHLHISQHVRMLSEPHIKCIYTYWLLQHRYHPLFLLLALQVVHHGLETWLVSSPVLLVCCSRLAEAAALNTFATCFVKKVDKGKKVRERR